MKSLKLATSLVLATLCSTACAPDPLVGTWQGQTAGCGSAEHDDISVTVLVLEDRSVTVTSSLGIATSGDAVVCSGGSVALDEADTDLAFTSTTTCDGKEIERRFALTPSDALPDTQSGTIEVLVDGAPFGTCELTVTR